VAAIRVTSRLAVMTARYFGSFVRLVRHLRRDRPDVLHAFLYPSYIVAAPAALLAGVPVLVAGRRSLGDCVPHHPVLAAASRVATRFTDLVIANADAVAEDARRVEGVPARKITTVYNGIPGPAFDPVPAASLATQASVILCVANLIGYKGHRYLLQAAARLRRRAIDCTFVLVGDGRLRN
jgi:glycosyltransferase involved in cell wall biosynthesis